jgi:hypothetical protein
MTHCKLKMAFQKQVEAPVQNFEEAVEKQKSLKE